MGFEVFLGVGVGEESSRKEREGIVLPTTEQLRLGAATMKQRDGLQSTEAKLCVSHG